MKKITVVHTTTTEKEIEIEVPFFRTISSGFEMVTEAGHLVIVIDNRLGSVRNAGNFDIADHYNEGEKCAPEVFFESLAKALQYITYCSGIDIHQLVD
jgi:hypothetical protein